MDIEKSPLLTDLYQLNMMQAYLTNGLTGTAVFEFFVRRLPERRAFLLAVGLEQALDFLEGCDSPRRILLIWQAPAASIRRCSVT